MNWGIKGLINNVKEGKEEKEKSNLLRKGRGYIIEGKQGNE